MGERRRLMVAAPVIVEKLKYVHQDVDRHGNVRLYFWRGKGHKKTRIRQKPGSAEFRRVYDELLAGAGQAEPLSLSEARLPKPDTYRWLCVQYLGSVEFKQLDETTRRVRRQILEHTFREPIAPGAKESFADFPISRFGPKAVRVLRDRKASAPEAANGRLKAIRQVFAWAMERDELRIDANPARDVKNLRGKKGGFHSWTTDEVEQFEARHPVGTMARLALALLLYTTQRRSDVVLLGRQHISKGLISLTQFKNRNVKPVALQIPVHPELQAIIDATPSTHMTFLVTMFGKPFTAAGFGNWFRKRCNEAGLRHCAAHGLRKAATALMAEGGATTKEIMSVTGHTTSKEVDRYAAGARQKRLAKSAMGKFGRDEG